MGCCRESQIFLCWKAPMSIIRSNSLLLAGLPKTAVLHPAGWDLLGLLGDLERVLGSARAEITCGFLSNVFPCVRLSLQREIL